MKLLIGMFRIFAIATLSIGTIVGFLRFGTSFLLGLSTIVTCFVVGIIFWAIAEILEYLQRIAHNTDYLVSNVQDNKLATKKKSYPELGKVQNNKQTEDDTEESALDKLLNKNKFNFYD